MFHHIYLCRIYFICSPVDGYLSCFYIMAIVNNTAMNTELHITFQISVFIFFGYIRDGIAGLYCGSIFNFLRNLYADFHISHIKL